MLTIIKYPIQSLFGLRALAITFLMVVGMSASVAQQTEQPDAEEGTQNAAPNAGMSKEQLLSLIANEIVLAPGIGLRNVRLGESMEAVRDRLGTATEVTTEGLVGKQINLVYKLDSGTSIVLTGKSVLERISVKGNASALVRTSQGARFGMQSRLIRQIYKEPTKTRKTRLEYRQLGATFYLADDRVNRIDLYPRRG